MIALTGLLFLITLFVLFSKVAAVALETTGMARESAQFQSRSALMGVGYTTAEAEDITNHPVRRRIVLFLMTFGNAGVITGIGSFLLTFIDTEATQTAGRLAFLMAGTVLVLVAAHLSIVDRLIGWATRAALGRYTTLDVRDYAALLRFDDEYAITELHARSGEWMVGRPLADLHLTREGVVILGINRSDGEFFGTPTGETIIDDGDEVLAYGRIEVLAELCQRPSSTGDAIHLDVANAHRRRLEDHGQE